jgi:hypothetical protein
MLLGACTKHEERHLTPWLKVDIARPRTGSSGVVVLGSTAEVFHVKSGRRWVRLGTGHSSSYMTLADEQAALVDLHDGKGLLLLRADRSPQSVSLAFGRSGDVVVPPGRDSIDIFGCRVVAAPAGCREAQIDRFDLDGQRLASFTIALPGTYSDCQILRIDGYDNNLIPHAFAQCKVDSKQARCVILAPQDGAPFLYAVGVDQPWRECSELSRAGVSLRKPEQFEVLR